jgi:hypothetical protein
MWDDDVGAQHTFRYQKPEPRHLYAFKHFAETAGIGQLVLTHLITVRLQLFS